MMCSAIDRPFRSVLRAGGGRINRRSWKTRPHSFALRASLHTELVERVRDGGRRRVSSSCGRRRINNRI